MTSRPVWSTLTTSNPALESESQTKNSPKSPMIFECLVLFFITDGSPKLEINMNFALFNLKQMAQSLKSNFHLSAYFASSFFLMEKQKGNSSPLPRSYLI